MTTVEHVLAAQNVLGEGPRWHTKEQTLYWVDIEGQCFYRLTPATGRLDRYAVGQKVGCLGFLSDGGLVMGVKEGLALWDFEAQRLMLLTDNAAYRPRGRFNDGAADRQGRFWAGTYSDEPVNHLFRLDADGSVHVMETGVSISNGIGWSLDNRTMYYVDSGPRVMYAYDFDPASGTIANRRVLLPAPAEADGTPDGLTVDSEGFIWCARWGGWKVVRFDPAGQIEREIRLPAQYPTSCAFGGPDLDELYITSASEPLDEAGRRGQPQAGDLFRVRPGVRGLPEPVVRLEPSVLAALRKP